MATKVPWPLARMVRPAMGRSCTVACGPVAVQRSSTGPVVPSWVYRVNPSPVTEIDEPGW